MADSDDTEERTSHASPSKGDVVQRRPSTEEAPADTAADTGLEGGVDEPNEALDAELEQPSEESEA
jgi:hypothetical protein